MQRIVLTYGSISGLIVILTSITGIYIASGDSQFEFTAWMGYTSMLIALSMIFIGIKRFRDDHQGGVITFGKAMVIGIGIAATAGVIYVLIWEIYLIYTDYAYIDHYVQSVIDARRTAGADEATMKEVIAEMEQMKTQYGNPLFRLPITFLEIFPVGLLITLISAAILRRSDVLPATE